MTFLEVTASIFVLNLGLFGIFISLPVSKLKGEKLTLKLFWNSTSKSIWGKYFSLLLLLFLVNFILFNDLFGTNQYPSGVFDFIDTNHPMETKESKFFSWLNSIIGLLKVLLPYFLAMLLVLYSYNSKITKSVLKTNATNILTAFILCFVTEIISENIFFYFKYYIVELVNIPFDNVYYSATIVSVIFLVISAYFLTAVTGALSLPFSNKDIYLLLEKIDDEE